MISPAGLSVVRSLGRGRILVHAALFVGGFQQRAVDVAEEIPPHPGGEFLAAPIAVDDLADERRGQLAVVLADGGADPLLHRNGVGVVPAGDVLDFLIVQKVLVQDGDEFLGLLGLQVGPVDALDAWMNGSAGGDDGKLEVLPENLLELGNGVHDLLHLSGNVRPVEHQDLAAVQLGHGGLENLAHPLQKDVFDEEGLLLLGDQPGFSGPELQEEDQFFPLGVGLGVGGQDLSVLVRGGLVGLHQQADQPPAGQGALIFQHGGLGAVFGVDQFGDLAAQKLVLVCGVGGAFLLLLEGAEQFLQGPVVQGHGLADQQRRHNDAQQEADGEKRPDPGGRGADAALGHQQHIGPVRDRRRGGVDHVRAVLLHGFQGKDAADRVVLRRALEDGPVGVQDQPFVAVAPPVRGHLLGQIVDIQEDADGGGVGLRLPFPAVREEDHALAGLFPGGADDAVFVQCGKLLLPRGDLFLVAGEVFLGVGIHPHSAAAFAGDDAVHRRETDEKVEAGVAEQRQGGPGLLEIGHQLLDGALVFGAPQVRVAGFFHQELF